MKRLVGLAKVLLKRVLREIASLVDRQETELCDDEAKNCGVPKAAPPSTKGFIKLRTFCSACLAPL